MIYLCFIHIFIHRLKQPANALLFQDNGYHTLPPSELFKTDSMYPENSFEYTPLRHEIRIYNIESIIRMLGSSLPTAR